MPADNTVAIVAIGATAFVGVVAPAIAAVAEKSRQRREHKHARELNDLAERRRVILEAMDRLTVFDWMTAAPYQHVHTEAEALDATMQFASALVRLQAVLGPESTFARAYGEICTLVIVGLALERGGDTDKIKDAQHELGKKRRELAHLARPYLLAAPDDA